MSVASSKIYILGYSARNHKFKRLEPHFQISATRSGWKVTETAIALPHSRQCTQEPMPSLPNYGSRGKFGARAELRNMLQEKLIGRGGSSCRFDCVQNIFSVGNATQVSSSTHQSNVCVDLDLETKYPLTVQCAAIALRLAVPCDWMRTSNRDSGQGVHNRRFRAKCAQPQTPGEVCMALNEIDRFGIRSIELVVEHQSVSRDQHTSPHLGLPFLESACYTVPGMVPPLRVQASAW